MKTVELSGTQLDWAVGRCRGLVLALHGVVPYSTDWVHGGPIIEREGLSLEFRPMGSMHEWVALSGDEYAGGETPLIAAMRCYVASKLGEEIDLPVEIRDHEQDCPAMDGFGCKCEEEVK